VDQVHRQASNCHGLATRVTVARGDRPRLLPSPLNASPPPTTNGVDWMYCQLAEIHAIAVVQLAECTYWDQSDPTCSPVWAGTGW
jgi:hypothetical protein